MSEMKHTGEKGVGLTRHERVALRWWAFKAWFHRCAECGHWPDKHYDSAGPRWEDDKVAHMLGIGQYGCRRCGRGAIVERDARRVTPPAAFTENCLPSGCSCGCHNPAYGIHYSHMVPCCAQSGAPDHPQPAARAADQTHGEGGEGL